MIFILSLLEGDDKKKKKPTVNCRPYSHRKLFAR